VLRQIYDQMSDPKWVISMGVCASSGGMFNNYAIVQGVDHVVPVDIYLPGCPPRPEMLLDAIVKLHDKIMNMKLGVNREREVTELEEARLRRLPLATDLAGRQSRTAPASGPTLLDTPALPSPAVRSRNLGMTSPAVHRDARATEAQPAEARAAGARATEAQATEAGAAGE
jgi:NADH ubiquinone oxidoreductase, 20 Kd subunit